VQQPQQQPQPRSTHAEPSPQTAEQKRLNLLRRTLAGWGVYAQQPVLPAAFALALLYLTVMSLGEVLTSTMGCPANDRLHCAVRRAVHGCCSEQMTLLAW
jgi:Ferroportin1 (FPN1)